MANKVGRPTAYRKKYCKELLEFFDVEPYEDREIEHYDGKTGNVKWIDFKRMANPLPTIRKFAKHINVSFPTVYEWTKKHKEFFNAFILAQELRKWFLIENGLNGCYNPLFAKFVAVNITDMADKVTTDPNGGITVSDIAAVMNGKNEAKTIKIGKAKVAG